jgi:hypothetical protein
LPSEEANEFGSEDPPMGAPGRDAEISAAAEAVVAERLASRILPTLGMAAERSRRGRP